MMFMFTNILTTVRWWLIRKLAANDSIAINLDLGMNGSAITGRGKRFLIAQCSITFTEPIEVADGGELRGA